ncbi:hypothetical protein SNA_08100 [Streptomyces natalensis ATCC 27448]|uniref:DUF2330 domain-containing protein n=2 Tax=Streptomyces natalensis TaxID=68242 RepID=A0A0D7CT21_9ACTN|nr:hypothetical protein SNA_08100 [Streptomyces natalensis ATCC 27448]
MLLAVQLVWLARPAYACGCGAMVVDPKTTLSVDRETSAVRWDGKTEQIVMSLAVAGTAPDAAWIMPVPHRATVKLGDSALFDELARVTAPADKRRTYFWPHSGDWPFSWGAGDSAEAPLPGARPGVGVVGRQRLGPFDVARLTATDPEALRGWLRSHGFTLPSALAGALRPYVAQHWEYVAVRLAPDDRHGYRGYLTGTLDPLRLSFASDRLVYPMRLSRLAKTPQSLGLYVFAPHRMEPRSAIGGAEPHVFFAGRIRPTGAVRRLTGPAPTYLTALDQHFPHPERITGDHELRRAATDTPYRRVHYIEVLLKLGGVPAWIVVVGGALVLLHVTALAIALTSRRRARRRGSAAAAAQEPSAR